MVWKAWLIFDSRDEGMGRMVYTAPSSLTSSVKLAVKMMP
jgi:hypothetical protein